MQKISKTDLIDPKTITLLKTLNQFDVISYISQGYANHLINRSKTFIESSKDQTNAFDIQDLLTEYIEDIGTHIFLLEQLHDIFNQINLGSKGENHDC